MAKPEWGVKRTCQSCGARFYDMARTPIVCPKCAAVVEPEVTFKPRRQATPAEPKAPPIILADDEAVDLDVAAEDLDVVDAEDAEETATEGEEEEDGALIEDASDLGEDDDDMAEVMEHLDEDLENEI